MPPQVRLIRVLGPLVLVTRSLGLFLTQVFLLCSALLYSALLYFASAIGTFGEVAGSFFPFPSSCLSGLV